MGWAVLVIMTCLSLVLWWWRARRTWRTWSYLARRFGFDGVRRGEGGVLFLSGSAGGREVRLFGDPQPGDLPFCRVEVDLGATCGGRFRLSARSPYRYLAKQPQWGAEVREADWLDERLLLESESGERPLGLSSKVVARLESLAQEFGGVVTREEKKLCYSRLGSMLDDRVKAALLIDELVSLATEMELASARDEMTGSSQGGDS